MYITHVLIFLIPILSQNDRDDNKNNIAYLSFFGIIGNAFEILLLIEFYAL